MHDARSVHRDSATTGRSLFCNTVTVGYLPGTSHRQHKRVLDVWVRGFSGDNSEHGGGVTRGRPGDQSRRFSWCLRCRFGQPAHRTRLGVPPVLGSLLSIGCSVVVRSDGSIAPVSLRRGLSKPTVFVSTTDLLDRLSATNDRNVVCIVAGPRTDKSYVAIRNAPPGVANTGESVHRIYRSQGESAGPTG